MASSRRNRVTEYECTECLTVLFGDELSLHRHIYTNRRKNRNQIRLPEKVEKLFQSKEFIEQEGARLAKESNDALFHKQMILNCCNRLVTSLSTVYNACKAYPFGSRISGLGHKDSDLDVFIDVGNMYTGTLNLDTLSQVTLVRKASAVFMKLQDEFSGVVTVATARTPIVKLYHKPSEIDCDLSFKHGLSVENTKFLRYCVQLQPICQPFILLLKKWSEINGFKEHMSNYAVTIMAIFYLQVNGYLLSIKELRQFNPEKSIIIQGWPTVNYTASIEEMKSAVKCYTSTLHNLLLDFFLFYSKFNYLHDVVCPLLGHTIKKDLFKSKNKLMVEMPSYVMQLNGEEPEEFRAQSVFCIQDPFDLSHNLTKAWQEGTLNKFKTLCDLTYKHLSRLN